jgi:hypothetical protein
VKITIKKLQDLNACKEGIEWVKEQKCLDLKKLIENAIATKDMNILRYANWGIVRFLSKEDKIRYAIYAAEQVIGIFEKKYPKDDRPRKAIEAAKEYLKNPSQKNKAAVDAAAAAVDAAAAAAYAAAYAAYAAAAANAADAAAAANAAADAAAYAADANAADANAAARIKMLTKILKYGIKLL